MIRYPGDPLDHIIATRDTTGIEAGQRVIYRRSGSTVMSAGRIESVDSQRPFPVEVLLDDGETVLALCSEVAVFPPVSPEWVERFLNEGPPGALR